MLDELSIAQQKLVAEHNEQLGRLETSYREEARETQEQFKVLVKPSLFRLMIDYLCFNGLVIELLVVHSDHVRLSLFYFS